MDAKGYVEQALAEVGKDNFIEALKILEQGHNIFRDSIEILELMDIVQSSLKHLESKEAYKDFYEKIHKDELRFLTLIERKLRTWIGKRTRKILSTFPGNVRYQQIEQEIRKGNFRNILDVGCNSGSFSLCLGARNPSLKVVGIDVVRSNIKKANELNRCENVTFLQGFAEDLHTLFAPDSFDLVMLFEILEHVISVEEVLDSALKVMKDNGMIVITVPEGFFNHPDNGEHVRYFSDKLISDLFSHRKKFNRVKVLSPEPGNENRYWNYITFLK